MGMCGRAAVAAAVAAIGAAAALGGEVFVVSDVYGIMPDGAVLEVAGKAFGPLREKNVHWDAASRTIRMWAARNEEVAVQIVIDKAGKGFSGKMSDLVGPGKIPAGRASFSAMCWVKVASRSVRAGHYPDLVIPLDGSVKGIRSFDVPLSIEGLPRPDNKVGVMLFEVWVPAEAAAGKYTGTVWVMAGGSEAAKLKVELEVFDFALPAMPTYAMDLLAYSMPSRAFGAGHYVTSSGVGVGAKAAPERTRKIDYQVYTLAADNRCFVNVLPYHSQRGTPRQAYPVVGQGADARIMSFKEYDDYIGPILDGKCGKFGAPPAHFTLPFNTNYPHKCVSTPAGQFNWRPFKNTVPTGPGKDPRLKEFEDTFKAVAEQWVRHLAEKGWTKTRFEVYYNQKPNPNRSQLPWKLDEPTHGPDYKGLRYLFNVAHWAFASAKAAKVQVVTRIDIGHFHCDKFLTPDGKPTRCWKAKQYDTHGAEECLKTTVDHWVIGSTHSQAAQHKLAAYEREGVKMMVYGFSKTGITYHYGEYAGAGYRSARIGLVGRILYCLAPMDPNKYGLKSSTVYSGQCMGFDGALAPHRLKLWRNAVNDFEYIVEARKKDKAGADAVVAKMTRMGKHPSEPYRKRSRARGYWVTNNVEDFARAKLALAAIITGGKVPAGMAIEGFSKKYNPCGTPDQIVGYD